MQQSPDIDLRSTPLSPQQILTQARYGDTLWFVSAQAPHRLDALFGEATETLHPEDADSLARSSFEISADSDEFDHRRRQKNEEWLWFRSQVRPMPDASGWVLQDVTTKGVVCRTRLGATSERLRCAFASANAAIWDFNLEEQQAYFGPRCYQMLGYDIDSHPAALDLWSERIHPKDRLRTIRSIWRELRSQKPFSVDYRFCHADGEWHWMRCNGAGEYDLSQKLIRVTGVHVDIHEQKQLDFKRAFERKLDLCKAELSRSLLQQSSVEAMAEMVLGAAMELTGSDSGFIAALPEKGMTPYPVHASGWFTRRGLLYRGVRPCWSTVWHQGEELILPAFSSLQNLAGVPINFRTKTEGLLMVGGRPHSFTESDLTVLRWLASLYALGKNHLEIAAQLEHHISESSRLNTARQQFLANMSHEIRTPLNGVLGMLTLMQMTDLNAEQQEYVNVAERAGNGLLTLLNDFLAFSQLDRNLISSVSVPFKPKEVLSEVTALYVTEMNKKRVLFACNLHESLPETLWGDPKGLRQIVLNLLGNAVKFTERGTISLSCRYEVHTGEQGVLLLRLQDSGIGVCCGDIETIFEPFEQGDGSMTRQREGGGLGLSISRKLITAMGGDLVFASTERCGTTALVRLPLATTKSETKEDSSSSRKEPLQILLADESTADRQLVRWMIEQLGQRLTVRLGDEKVRAALVRSSYDLLLIGISSLADSGLGIIDEIRQRDDSSAWMSVVAMVPHGNDNLRQRALAAGATRVLEKPFSLEQVTQLLKGLR